MAKMLMLMEVGCADALVLEGQLSVVTACPSGLAVLEARVLTLLGIDLLL